MKKHWAVVGFMVLAMGCGLFDSLNPKGMLGGEDGFNNLRNLLSYLGDAGTDGGAADPNFQCDGTKLQQKFYGQWVDLADCGRSSLRCLNDKKKCTELATTIEPSFKGNINVCCWF